MDSAYLFSTMLWGSVGLGFILYGRKKKSFIPIIGGILLMWVPLIAKTWINIALWGLAISAAILIFMRRM